MMDDVEGSVGEWSVAALGTLLVAVASTHAYLDADRTFVDFVEVSLPFAAGTAIALWGVKLGRRESPAAIARIGAWGLGGVVVGEAIILWFTFIVSLEQQPMADPAVMHLNSSAIAMGSALLLGHYSTAKRQTTAGLRETNRRLEAVMATVEASIFIKDVDGRYQLMNEQCREVLGLEESEVVGLTDDDLFPEELAAQSRRDDERVLETGETIRVEEEVPTPNGTRTHLTLKSPLLDEDGEPRGICAVATDISGRKARERQLNARSAAIETSIDGIAILNNDDEYVYVNDAHASVYGYDGPEAFLGEKWYMCYDDAELERFESEVLPELLETGGWLGEATGVRKDGSTFPQELSLSVLDDGGIVCVVRDVSERLRYRDELERQNARLEEFANVVSHDLRNPLSVAAGQLELAREECESESLAEVAWAIDRMDELIEDVLALARVGALLGEMEPVELADLSEESWRNVETAAATLSVETDAVVRADRSRLKQLVENLLRNAIEHGGEDVQVRVGSCEDGFFVEDDGNGIPSSESEVVFERGYSTDADGTGFGLPIVEEIADAHGWSVSVAEREDAGARFEITGVEQ